MSFLFIVALLVIGFLFVFFEIFVPGGLLGFIGAVLMGVAIYMCFKTEGAQTGWIVLVSATVLATLVVVVGFKYIPNSAIGKVLILKQDVSKKGGYTSQADDSEALMGQEGIAETDLRPTGIARIDGKRIDVMADGEYLSKGVSVRVVEVASNRIMVRQA